MLFSASVFAGSGVLSGVYLEGNVGYSYIKEKVINSGNDNNDGIGWNISGGYLFDPNWTIEGGYTKHADETFGGGVGAVLLRVSIHCQITSIYLESLAQPGCIIPSIMPGLSRVRIADLHYMVVLAALLLHHKTGL